MSPAYSPRYTAPREIEIAARVAAARGPDAAARVLGWPATRVIAASKKFPRRKPAGPILHAVEICEAVHISAAADRTGYWPEEIAAEIERRKPPAEPVGWKDYERWTEAEDQLVRDRYPRVGAKGLASLLSRSPEAIKSRAQYLRQRPLVRKPIVPPFGRKTWEPHEDATLREWYGRATYPEISAKLPGRTPRAVARRAENLGLIG